MRWIAALQLLWLTLQLTKPLHASSESLYQRDISTSSLPDQRGALLVVDGKQTTCEVALIDSRSGYVAASCVKPKNGKVDVSKKYEVFIDNGPKASPSKYRVSDIEVSFLYYEATYMINLAIVQFNKEEEVSWKNPVAEFSTGWDDLYYVRRTLDNAQDMKWNTPVVKAQLKDSDGCSEASETYKKNPNAFLCIDSGTQSIFKEPCQVPYGSIYAVKKPGDMSIAALYSHSSVYGTDTCGNSKQFHYYTVLGHYNSWASSYLKYNITTLSPPTGAKTPPPSWSGDNNIPPSNPKITTFSGDLYPRQGVIPPLGSSAEANNTQTSTTGGSKPTTSASDSASGFTSGSTSASVPASTSGSAASNLPQGPSSGNNGSGITRTAIIAIAVAVPAGTLLGVIALFLLRRWWKKRHNERTWNANQERDNYNALQIMNEIGGATNRDSELPSYERVLFGDRPMSAAETKSK
ncbi:hypothetical protein GGI12_005189 [Dipsacomyces acuminosporus]|nr:hypothetical protein GGI12_005189 [Dipsacomyces acuminosporus]